MKENVEFDIHDVVPWQDEGACLFIAQFEPHVTENVKAVFAKENTNLVPVAGRLTSVLQPLLFLEWILQRRAGCCVQWIQNYLLCWLLEHGVTSLKRWLSHTFFKLLWVCKFPTLSLFLTWIGLQQLKLPSLISYSVKFPFYLFI